ncbi:type 1 fimbrial protein, partial [Salmonella enterica]|nr:type 1 fimbrial protein [Salmonella enterica]
DPVTGGSGTVTINVPIVTSTCSVSVPTEVNLDPINKNSLSGAGLVESKNFDTVFSNCKDKTLQMSVQTANPLEMGSSPYAYFDSGDPDHAFYYNIQPPKDAEITGGGRTSLFEYLILVISILCLSSPAAIIIPCRQKLTCTGG